MTRVALPGSSRETTAAGFGCAALTGGWSQAASVRLVHAALDAGFRHFDVAPPYGMGSAEDVLGAALAGRRAGVTIATKVGIARPVSGPALRAARALAAPLRRLAPGLARETGALAYRAARRPGRFAVPQLAASLAESLRRLRTDRIDVLLLHEVDAGDIGDDLLAFLDARRRDGSVGAIGTATSVEQTAAIRAARGACFDVWQHRWSALDGAVTPLAPFTVVHGCVGQALGRLPDLPSLSGQTGLDLGDPALLADVLLGAARAHNPGGIVLTASRSAERLRSNARALGDPRLQTAGAALLAALAG